MARSASAGLWPSFAPPSPPPVRRSPLPFAQFSSVAWPSAPRADTGGRLELAEDLDRWRADLPLAYAAEPFWAQTLPRCARRNKKLFFAVGLVLVMCLVATYLVVSRIQSRWTLQGMAMHKLARNWDDIESHAFQFQRPGSPRLQNPDAPEAVATAAHALKEYDVFGRGDWRQREDVRNLPEGDRNDLALWLMEQTFLYCRALGDRPDSPGDWRRAIAALDRVSTTPPLQAFETLRRRLHARLGQSGTPHSQAQEQIALPPEPDAAPESLARRPPEPPWLEDYLLGVAAELEGEPDPALQHYDRVLARSPDSLWGHYSAAVVCFQLRRWSEATRHLECCLKRRSENVALHAQSASCLYRLELPDDALHECSRALDSAPDYAKFYQSRSLHPSEPGPGRGAGGRSAAVRAAPQVRDTRILPQPSRPGHGKSPPGHGASLTAGPGS